MKAAFQCHEATLHGTIAATIRMIGNHSCLMIDLYLWMSREVTCAIVVLRVDVLSAILEHLRTCVLATGRLEPAYTAEEGCCGVSWEGIHLK